MKTILTILSLFFSITAFAQPAISPAECERLFQKAASFERNGNYRQAIQTYNAVIECNPSRKKEINDLVIKVFEKIEAQRNAAVKAEKALQKEKKKVETERDKARRAQEEAQRQAYRAEQSSMSNYNVSLALRTLQSNPTLALRIAERNFQLHPQELAAEATYFRILGDTSLRFYRQSLHLDGQVNTMAIRSDGALAAAGLENGQIFLWQPNSNVETKKLISHFRHKVVSVAFSPDNRYLITGTSQTVFIWELTKLDAPFFKLENIKSTVVSAGFSPDSRHFFFAQMNGTLEIRPTERPEEISRTFSHKSGLQPSVSFSPDGKKILAAGGDIKLLLWDFDQVNLPPQVLSGHLKQIYKAVFTPDGNEIISCGADGLICHWNLSATQNPVRSFAGDLGKVLDLAIHPSGKSFITVGEDKTVKLWDFAQGRISYTYTGNTDFTTCCFIEPASGYFWSGSRNGIIRQWPLVPRSFNLTTMHPHTSDVENIVLTPESPWIYSSGMDGKICRWKEGKEEEFECMNAHELAITDLSLSADGTILYSTGLDRLIKKWVTGPSLHLEQVSAVLPAAVYDLALSPSASLLAAACRDSIVRIWKTDRLQEAVLLLKGFNGRILTVLFAPDEKSIFTGGEDGIIRQWSLTTPAGTVLRTWTGHSADVYKIYLTKDAKRLYSLAHGNNIRVWDAERTQTPAKVFELARITNTIPYLLCFSHDESEFATIVASAPGKEPPVGVFSKTGTEPYWTYFGDTLGTSSLQYSPSGDFLYFGLWNGFIEKRGTPGWFVRNQVAPVSLDELLDNGFQIDSSALYKNMTPNFLPAIANYFYRNGAYDAALTAWQKVIQNNPSPLNHWGMYITEKMLGIDRITEYLQLDSLTIHTFAGNFKKNGDWANARLFFEKLSWATKDEAAAGLLVAQIYEVCLRGNIPFDRDRLFNFPTVRPYGQVISHLLYKTHGTWTFGQQIVIFKDVQAILDKIRNIDPTDERILKAPANYPAYCECALSNCYYYRGEYANALPHFLKCLQYDDFQNEWYAIKLPLVYLINKRYDDALNTYKATLKGLEGEEQTYYKEVFLSDLSDFEYYGRFNAEQLEHVKEIRNWLNMN